MRGGLPLSRPIGLDGPSPPLAIVRAGRDIATDRTGQTKPQERRKHDELDESDEHAVRREEPEPDWRHGYWSPGCEVARVGERPEHGAAEATVGQRVEERMAREHENGGDRGPQRGPVE